MHETTTETTQIAGTPLAAEPERPYTPEQGEAMKSPVTEPRAGRRNGRVREPLTRAESLLITMFITMIGALLAAGALAFTSLSGQISETNGQMLELQRQMHEDNRALREEIGELRTEMHEQIGGLRDEMHEQIGELRDEMAEMRTEMGELSDRITRIEAFLQIHHGPLPGP